VVETQLRIADNALLAGDDNAALALQPMPNWDANLLIYARRLQAIAQLGRGDEESARHSITDSVTQARAADIPFELGQSLLVAAGIDDVPDAASEAAEIFDRLGVVRRPPLWPVTSLSAPAQRALAEQ
jgi:hypothetical protein